MNPSRIWALWRRVSWWHWLAVFSALAAVDYTFTDTTRIVDQRVGDVLLRWHAKQRPSSDDVVVIDIDQDSLERMYEQAGSWPWPRSVHGELLGYLARQKPKAVVFDIMFTEPDVYRPEHDKLLADALAATPNVYLPQTLEATGLGASVSQYSASLGMTPTDHPDLNARIPLLVPSAVFAQLPLEKRQLIKAGLINFDADSDQIGRKYLMFMARQGWRFASLPAKLASDLGWPAPDASEFMLNWRRAPRHVAYADLYLDAQKEKSARPLNEFKDKILVIGTGAPGLQDLRPTPLASTYPGVDMLATAIDNLRVNDWLREIPRLLTLPLALGLMIALAYAFAGGLSPTRIALGLAAGNVVVIGVAAWQLGYARWLPVYSALAFAWGYYAVCAVVGYLQERDQRERAIGMFNRFLDPRVVGDLVKRGEIDTQVNAESREITVLFSDIRGFTTLSETRSPEAIVSLLNRYFSTQVEIIFRHGGTLDKFIGDAIMAFWGAPVNDPEHAKHAVLAAIEMSEALVRFKAELTDLGHDFDIGIGLHSGPAVVGFIGSKDRMDYTTIGDTVNLASRIEGQTKGIARVLVSEATMNAAGLVAFHYRDCGLHHVKGREQEVRLFEPSLKT